MTFQGFGLRTLDSVLRVKGLGAQVWSATKLLLADRAKSYLFMAGSCLIRI